MSKVKADIIAALQKEIISLETPACMSNQTSDIDLGLINNAFPSFIFPTAAIHEFISSTNEDAAATIGFISSIVSALTKNKSTAIWITNEATIFTPALKSFGIDPGNIIFIRLKKDKEILWATEAALKCEALGAVIANIPNLDFTVSRRLQLAVEKSKVTGFILRQTKNKITPTACVSRWKIQSMPSEIENELPGVGFPKWKVELLKIRNGKPGEWVMEWKDQNYHFINETILITDQNKIAV